MTPAKIVRSALACSVCLIAASTYTATYTTWSDYGGSPDSMQYSALKQINKSNVATLQQAWFYPTPGTTGRFAFTPLVMNGVMYVALKDGIDAVDAATGKRIWTHPTEGQPTSRG